jgi:hypothetical protein
VEGQSTCLATKQLAGKNENIGFVFSKAGFGGTEGNGGWPQSKDARRALIKEKTRIAQFAVYQ